MNPLILALISAAGFGLWPSIARVSGLNPILTAIIVGSATLIPAIFAIPFSETGRVSASALFVCVFAGIINGVGFIAYAKLVSNAELSLSLYVPVTIINSLIVAVAAGILIFHEPITAQKITGIILAAAATWLLLK